MSDSAHPSPCSSDSPHAHDTRSTLESLQAWLAELVDESTDAIVGISPAGVVMSWNGGAEQLFGYTQAEIVGQSVAILYPPERAQELAQLLARLQQGEPIRGFETERLTKTGTRLPVLITFSPLQDPQGNVTRIACILRDQRSGMQMEDRVRFQSQLLDAVDHAVIATDTQGRITYWNRFAEQMYGWSAAEVVGRPILDVTPAGVSQAQAAELMSALQGGGHWLGEFWVQHRDGHRFLAEVSDSPILDAQGRFVGVVGISHDISERKRQEQVLEQRVVERTVQWQAASEELRRLAAHLQSAREDERASIARDLHDDLAQAVVAVTFELSSLARKLTKDPHSFSFSRADAVQQVEGIRRMLDEMIQSIRALIKQLRPELLDEMDLLAALALQAEQFQARSGIVCQFSTDVHALLADPNRTLALYRIVQEALTNVARHAGATRVDVSLRQLGDQLLLEVHDNGRGIRPQELQKQDHFGITGMRERMIALGGEFSITGSPGGGTTVSVRMPLR